MKIKPNHAAEKTRRAQELADAQAMSQITRAPDNLERDRRAKEIGAVTGRDLREQLGWDHSQFTQAVASGLIAAPWFADEKGNQWWRKADADLIVGRHGNRPAQAVRA